MKLETKQLLIVNNYKKKEIKNELKEKPKGNNGDKHRSCGKFWKAKEWNITSWVDMMMDEVVAKKKLVND